MLSLMTSVAINVGALIGGAVVIEQFFGPGVGLRLFAVQANDLLVAGHRRRLAVAVVVTNLLVDLLYAVIDPRIRHARALSVTALTWPPSGDRAERTRPPGGARRRAAGPTIGVMFGVAWLRHAFMALFADYLPFIRG